ncbi:MAG TPA: lactate utilization protein C [Rhodocyclaceae bacterium]
MSARANILARLTAAPRGEPVPLPDLTEWRSAASQGDAAIRVARFWTNIGAAHAEVHDTDPDAWPDLLCRLAAEKGVRRMLIGTGAPSAERLTASAAGRLELVRYERLAHDWKDEMFDGIDAGFSPVKSAIADTGSLVLWPDAGAPRLLSLVPPIHFALLDASRIHADLRSAMIAERWADGMPTNALVVSGPSKTADIQQTLAYGAHGPRELVVLLVKS